MVSEVELETVNNNISGQDNQTERDLRLHKAVCQGINEVVDLLPSDIPTLLFQKDDQDRTPLHILAIKGGEGALEILRLLLLVGYPTENTSSSEEDPWNAKDNLGRTPLDYMAESYNSELVEAFIMHAMTTLDGHFWINEPGMTLLYEKCPRVIKGLMDAAFSKNPLDENKIVSDFGIITGSEDPFDKLRQQETKYLINARSWDYETQKQILPHPLVQLFLFEKCQKLRLIICIWLFWQIAWLIIYTWMALSTYTGVAESPWKIRILSGIMGLYILISLVNEVSQYESIGLAYTNSYTNVFQWIQNCLGIAAIFPVLTCMDLADTETIQPFKSCCAIGILLAYILSMRDIGKLDEEVGLVVEVLKQVVLQVIKVLFYCSPLLVGFTISFHILFEDADVFNSYWPGPFVKVLAMMTGELNYNELFNFTSSENCSSTEQVLGELNYNEQFNFTNSENCSSTEQVLVDPNSHGARLLLFLIFLISVPIAFFNYLTGTALEQVMDFKKRAEVYRIANRLEHVYFTESFLLRFHRWKVIFGKRFVQWLRKFNVTSVLNEGGDVEFKTRIIQEKLDLRTTASRIFAGSIFATELALKTRENIFALASKQNHNTQNIPHTGTFNE